MMLSEYPYISKLLSYGLAVEDNFLERIENELSILYEIKERGTDQYHKWESTLETASDSVGIQVARMMLHEINSIIQHNGEDDEDS